MPLLKHIIAITLFLGIYTPSFTQVSDTAAWSKQDTVVLKPEQIVPIQISCPVLNGFGSGKEELLVINSFSDMQYAFGYNCSFPDIDFYSKTMLRVELPLYDPAKTRVTLIGDEVILSVYVYKTIGTRKLLSVLIPKIGTHSSVHLDINDEENLPK